MTGLLGGSASSDRTINTAVISETQSSLGRALALECQERGWRVVALQSHETLPCAESASSSETAESVPFRVTPGLLTDADIVFHTGAVGFRGHLTLDTYYQHNVMRTLALVNAVCAAGKRVKRFVLASTDSVYRIMRPEYFCIRETDATNPGDYHGTSRLVSEAIVTNFCQHHEVPYTILRYGTLVSEAEILQRFRYDHAFALLTQCAEGRHGLRHPLLGHVADPVSYLRVAVPTPAANNPAVGLCNEQGLSWSSHYVDVRDAVNATMLAALSDSAINNIFNVAGPATTEYVAGAKFVADRLGLDLHVVAVPDRWAFELSIEKASRLLGFRPAWTYERMVDDALANPTPSSSWSSPHQS